MTQIFISYSRKDIAFIERLAIDLNFAGLDAWYDLSGLEGGARWRKEIEKAIETSDYVIVVLSPASIASTWVEEEILYARNLGRKIIPLLYKPCKIPLGLNTLNFINVQGGNYQQNYKEILRALNIERSKREAAEKARRDARKAVLEKIFSYISSVFQRLLTDSKSIFRFIGIFVIAIILFWLGSWGISKIPSFIPTANSTKAITKTPIPATRTLTAVATPTKTRTPIPTATLGVGSIMISDKDGVKLVYVPAGEFTMGSDADDVVAGCKKFKKVITDCQRSRFVDEEPPHSVDVEAFWIDQTEVTNKMYETCVSAGICDAPVDTSSGAHPSYFGNPEFQNYPVIFVNWDMAKTYCSWAGRRLPTEAEWEKTARGTNANIYPWGNAFDGNKLNFCDINCGISHQDESINDGYGDVSPVGNYPSGRSVFGAYDMAGNVWEWVSSLYSAYPYDANDGRENLSSSEDRVLRGGSWNSDGNVVRSALRISTTPDMTSWNFGFRCAMDAP